MLRKAPGLSDLPLESTFLIKIWIFFLFSCSFGWFFLKKMQGNVAAEEIVDEHAGHVHVHTHAAHGHAHGSSVTPSEGMHLPELVRHRIIAQVVAQIKFIFR
jgi:hypothetical protein